MKRQWTIEISQNGWEYTGYCFIECESVIRDPENKKGIIADGMKISFDEAVGDIY